MISRPRPRLFTAWFVILLVWLAQASPAGARNAASPPLESEPGTHYLVLIDDSWDMRSYRPEIERFLPRLLFEGETFQAAKPVPAFRPGQDRISLLFFTIHRNNLSALPGDLFQWVPVTPQDQSNQEQFAALLKRSLYQDGRCGGVLSPIATAKMLALPFVQKKLPPDELYVRTIIILVTNNLYNLPISPAYELTNYERGITQGSDRPLLKVNNAREAAELASQVSNYFIFQAPSQWNLEKRNKTYFLVSEVMPLVADVDSLLAFHREISLDRKAVSPTKLLLTTPNPDQANLRITSAERLQPLYLSWGFQSPESQEYTLGTKRMPEKNLLNLQTCSEPKCRREDNRITVPLLEAAEHLSLAATDPDLKPGQIALKVDFRFLARGLYDHFWVKSAEQRIKITPVAPQTISSIIFPRVRLDNTSLAALWSPADQEGLTQQAAVERINNTWQWKILVVMACVALALGLYIFYLFLTKYRRPFRPEVRWEPAPNTVLDFNQTPGSRLHIGTLMVVNNQPVPWFGNCLRNQEQPARQATISLSYKEPLDTLGLALNHGVPIGFVRAEQEEEQAAGTLVLSIKEAISHGKAIHIFLATEIVDDYRPFSADAPNIFLQLSFQWKTPGRFSREPTSLQDDFAFLLEVQPEKVRAPKAVFKPLEERLHFNGGSLKVGEFHFISQSEHGFALPFSGQYALQPFKDGFPMAGEPFILDGFLVTVPPGETVVVPVFLECDGLKVPNPNPSQQRYAFRLLGSLTPDSESGPHPVDLFRDPKEADLELFIVHQQKTGEIYWDDAGLAKVRWSGEGGGLASEEVIPESKLRLAPRGIEFHTPSSSKPSLFKIRVGNSAKNGQGRVEVQVQKQLAVGPVYGLHLREGAKWKDLIFSPELPGNPPQVVVKEGDAHKTVDFRLQPGLIHKIVGARIPAEHCAANFDLAITITTDQGRITRRRLTIEVPVRLEQLPGHNWLGIDFGTSAIATAYGTAGKDSVHVIDLQKVPILKNGASFGEYDPANSERKTPFLPSLVICDADLRQDAPRDYVQRNPGCPDYFPASFTPGDSSFLGLPAIASQLRDFPGRIIFSLKSWLGKTASHIILREPIRAVVDDGPPQPTTEILRDKVVTSGFNALSEGYLSPHPLLQNIDQIVLTYPNTFTDRHQKALHDIAWGAFHRSFGIAAPDRIRLIAESDAVAYYYCRQCMRNAPRGGQERILVYDFGAGTLDLSLIRILWQKEPLCRPKEWEVEGRLGLPLAGNHLDSLLARLIDRHLQDPQVLDPEKFEYQYPVVANNLKPDKNAHRDAILDLWKEIRQAKHNWDGQQPLSIGVGFKRAHTRCVKVLGEFDQLTPPPPHQVGLWVKDGHLYLSLPVAKVEEGLKEFVTFVTETVIQELLQLAKVPAAAVDTLIVSGRGARWPGLQARLQANFSPQLHVPKIIEDQGITMKDAVVRGAIARQGLQKLLGTQGFQETFRPKLAALLQHDEILVLEDKWDEPLDLSTSPTFRLVQIYLNNPDPADLHTIKKHLYLDLIDQPLNTDELTQVDKKLSIIKREEYGRMNLDLMDSDGNINTLDDISMATPVPVYPPWPVGSVLLDPDELPGG